jgi:RNA polymerase sigma factor (sigma-70 family)
MYLLLDVLALRLGKRPAFVAIGLLLLGLLLAFRLVKFVLQTHGFNTFEEATPQQAAWLMRSLILISWLLLILRLLRVNRKLRSDVLRQLRRARQAHDLAAERQVRRFVEELDIRGNVLARLLKVIEWAPRPFVALLAVLLLANVLLYSVYVLLKNADGVWGTLVFPNCPWAVATLVVIYLVINDVWVFDDLGDLVTSLHNLEPADASQAVLTPTAPLSAVQRTEHFQAFFQQLTHKEREVLRLRLLEERSLKEIAAHSHKSLSTVKTQINDINTKWRQYSTNNGLADAPLRAFVPVRVGGGVDYG